MTPMDVFDTMLDTIQQFPLECSRFERRNRRLNKDQCKYSRIFERIAFKLISPDDRKYKKVIRKLRKTIEERISVAKEFEEFVHKHYQRLTELIEISTIDKTQFIGNFANSGLLLTNSTSDNCPFAALEGNGPAIIKLNDIPAGTKRYCICDEFAFGTMICCDDPGCNIRWYHLKCAGISTVPKDTWKCPGCSSVQ